MQLAVDFFTCISRRRHSPLARYLFPFLAIALVLCVQFAVSSIVPKERDFPYALFYLIAIGAVAWLAGYVPGAMTCLLTMVAVPWAANPNFRLTSLDLTRLTLLTGVSLLVSGVAHAQRRLRESLRAANERLDQRVQSRTEDLSRAVASLESEVAQRKKTEEALRESEQRVDAALDAAGIGRWDIDLTTGGVTRSLRHDQIFGYDQLLPEWNRRSFVEHVVPEDRPVVKESFRAALHSRDAFEFDCRIQRRDGKVRWVWGRGKVLRDGAGTPVSILGSIRDTTDHKHAEEAARVSQERTRAIISGALDGVIVMDHEGCILEFNPAAEGIFGCSSDSVVGRALAHVIIPPRFREQHRRGLVHYLASGEGSILGQRMEVVGIRADGTEFPLELNIARMPGGGPPMFTGFLRDITESKQAGLALRESQERYQALAESLPHLVWTSNPEGECDYLSRQWAEYTGRPTEEQLGYAWAENIHPEERERALTAWAEAIARGNQFDLEFRLRRADGVYRWFHTRAVPLRHAEGHIVKWFGSNTDFEDYKYAEQRLQTQLGRMSLLDHITRAIGERQDLQGVFQAVIGVLEESMPIDFGCICLYEPVAQMLTVTCVGARSGALAMELALTEKGHIDIDQNGLARCVRGELVYEPEISQSEYPFPQRLARGGLGSFVAAPVEVESGIFGILVAARKQPNSFSSGDCEFLRQLSGHVALAARQAQIHNALQQAYDDLRLTQQAVMQRERLSALGQMASGIAHDINNALSPAALYTESLLETEPGLSAPGREYLRIIQLAIDDVGHTVGRMREFYRKPESQLICMPVNLNQLVQQVLDLTRSRWNDMPQQQGILIQMLTELAPALPTIAGIESEIREALVNLIFNAVDAMPNGGSLTLRTKASPVKSTSIPYLHLEVEDTGLGMDEETRRRCLEPFFTTKKERGTGLGLAMVFGVAQRHDAAIEIDSAIGKGTIVRLIFPIPNATPHTVQPAYLPKPLSQLRILVVDDDPLIIKSLRDILETDGHAVITANGGQEGIDVFRAAQDEQRFAVVITDLGMPRVDGRKVASAVKAACPSTPVIMLTGWGQRLVAEDDVPPHVDRVLNKPPKLRELRTILAELAANVSPNGCP